MLRGAETYIKREKKREEVESKRNRQPNKKKTTFPMLYFQPRFGTLV